MWWGEVWSGGVRCGVVGCGGVRCGVVWRGGEWWGLAISLKKKNKNPFDIF